MVCDETMRHARKRRGRRRRKRRGRRRRRRKKKKREEVLPFLETTVPLGAP